MAFFISNVLTEDQCEQVTILHTVCTEYAAQKNGISTDPKPEPSVLSLVLPDPGTEENDVFYALYYIEETLISFLSVFCPDGKTAEISGFTHPDHRHHGYFSALLNEAGKEASRRFGPVGFLYQCLSGDPDTDKFCRSHGLIHSHSECMMGMKIQKSTPDLSDGPLSFSVSLVQAGEKERETMVLLHMKAFRVSLEFTEPYIDSILDDRETVSFLIRSKEGKNVGLLHLTTEETGRIAYFMGLGILPKYRRKGYGKSALMTLMGLLPEGCTLLLQVSTSNSAAYELYKGLGFYVESKLDYFVSAPSAVLNVSSDVSEEE